MPVSRTDLTARRAEGLFACALPEALGGDGRSPSSWGEMLEQLSIQCSDSALPFIVAAHGLTSRALFDSGRSDLIEGYARPSVTGDRLGTFSEPEVDLRKDGIELVPSGGGELLARGRRPIPHGGLCDHFLVLATGPEGAVAFVLDGTDPGLTVHLEAEVLELDGVRLSAARMLAGADGLAARLREGRSLAALCVVLGRMCRAVHGTVAQLGNERKNDEPLTEDLSVRSALGKLYAAIETSRALVHHALEALRWSDEPSWESQLMLARACVADQLPIIAHEISHLGGPFDRDLFDALSLMSDAGAQHALHQRLGAELAARHQLDREALERAVRNPAGVERLLAVIPWWKRLFLRWSRPPR